LLIFDLDETLIHTVRDTEDMEEQQLMMLYNDMYGVEPDEWVDIMEPDSA
jgi:FMN phosphatase YigB (HAD superfamily)